MRQFIVKTKCSNCGLKVKWFAAVKGYLHTGTLQASCRWQTRAVASVTVRPKEQSCLKQ